MTTSASCITNLADANIAMVAGATLELCPGTYAVGSPLDDTLTTFAGGIPLIIDADDVTVKCGISGASANGCILEGGFAQIWIGNPKTPSATVNNLNISGITFTGVLESGFDGELSPRNIYGTGQSNLVTINDCLFTDITTTGFVMDIVPEQGLLNMSIVNSAFTNVAHGFDVIFGSSASDIKFNTVTFTNMTHILPEDDVDGCANLTAATCAYSSSIIHLAYTTYTTPTVEESFVDVTVKDSTFYTSILRTLGEWGFGTIIDTFTTLITVTNTTIYNQENRTANDDYCEGGYAAAYNATTGIDWKCKRVSYALDVVEILRCGINCDANGNFSTLFTALAATGLDATIAGNTNNVAIFAPTDEAFEQLPPGLLDDLLNDTATLTQLLLYHVTVEDPVLTDAIAAGLPAAKTVQGESVSFTPITATYDFYKVDEATIIHADWEESPGAGKVIQVIDRVIPPSTITILPSFSQLVESLNLTEFIAAGQAVGFDANLDPDKIYTLFAPSNGAIQNSSSTQALLSASDKTPLTELLNHHFLEGNFSIADLQAQGCLDKTSLASKNIKITFSNSEIRWNDAFTNTSTVNQLAYNGILHVIDGVLDPSDIKRCSSAARASMSIAFGLAGTILAIFVF
ncbi:unnamed protein product [Cylindrotheca closterium]|uniref:FAS1 domain-containing protein n=1 Tax=Cylindrotheca closterium TaxID=2856 RepID=A0AAD2CIR6_9STRA|nr:unnamed protein product [Cylindrotheca closterium]